MSDEKQICKCGLSASMLLIQYELAKENMEDVWAEGNVRMLDTEIASVGDTCNVFVDDARSEIDKALNYLNDKDYLRARSALNASRDIVVGALLNCAIGNNQTIKLNP